MLYFLLYFWGFFRGKAFTLRSIKVLKLGFFFDFSPFLVIPLPKRYLINLDSLLRPIYMWSLFEHFIETFNGPCGH